MSVGSMVTKIWTHPLMANVHDVDDAGRLPIYRRIIQSKPLLREGYIRWYAGLIQAARETAGMSGDMVEIGCGPGFLEEFIPELVKTDSVPNPFAHKTMDAMQMEYPDASLRAIYAIGVLHHLPTPRRFLGEAARCLKPGGRMVLVEPSKNYPRRILKFLNHYEHFDDTVESWDNPLAANMTGANLALPWVIFIRDRLRFDSEFPSLRIKSIHYHDFIAHFLAGAMRFRNLVPRPVVPSVFAFERMLEPFMERLGTMMTVDVEKTV
jgi:SAM-dependent methyltransferase